MSLNTNKPKLLESDIKVMIINYLKERDIINNTTLIMNELTVDNKTRRIDLAIYTNDKLIGFEIKSEADNLSRIGGQIETYRNFFDKIIIVADVKFKNEIEKIAPKTVGLWLVNDSKIAVKRKGRLNKTIKNKFLIKYLDLGDLKKLSTLMNTGSSYSRSKLEEILESAPNDRLRERMVITLERKFKLSSELFLRKTKNLKVESKHLKLLSRFYKIRKRNKIIDKENANFWKNIDSYLHQFEGEMKN